MDIKRADGGGSEFGLAVQIGTLSLPGNPHVESKSSIASKQDSRDSIIAARTLLA
jgi:hypothetical protein